MIAGHGIANVDSLRFSDEEYGQKNVSVMLDGQETELEIIDHPASEMSVSKMRCVFFSRL